MKGFEFVRRAVLMALSLRDWVKAWSHYQVKHQVLAIFGDTPKKHIKVSIRFRFARGVTSNRRSLDRSIVRHTDLNGNHEI